MKIKYFALAIFIAILGAITMTSPIHAATGGAPTLTYTVNGVDGMTTIVTAFSGDTLNIAWSATNVAYCKKWGVWGAGEVLNGLSGTDSVIAPTVSVVTGENYEIDCYDASGLLLIQGGAQVNVSPAIVITPTPTPITSSLVKTKGEGVISEVGSNYIVSNSVKIFYSSLTRIRLESGNISIGMRAKWDGILNRTNEVVASKLEVQ